MKKVPNYVRGEYQGHDRGLPKALERVLYPLGEARIPSWQLRVLAGQHQAAHSQGNSQVPEGGGHPDMVPKDVAASVPRPESPGLVWSKMVTKVNSTKHTRKT